MIDYLSSGRLEDHPFAALAGALFQGGRTGELTVESGDRRRCVWFLGGNPVAVVSDHPQDGLAPLLLEHTKITAEEAERLAAVPETRDALAAVDFVPKETIAWGVKYRFVNLCYDLFLWQEGDYAFRDATPPRTLSLLKVPANTLVVKGVGYLSRPTLIDLVPDDAVFAAGPVDPAGARYLGPEERGVLEECRPGRRVEEALSGWDDADRARQTVYALSCLGLIGLRHGGQAEAAPEPEAEGFGLDAPNLEEADTEPAPAAPELELEPEPEPRPTAEAALEPLGLDSTEALSGSLSDAFRSDLPGAGEAGEEEEEELAEEEPEPPRRSLTRIVGIVLGAAAAAVVIGGGVWWYLGGGESPGDLAPPPVKRVNVPPVVPLAPQAQAPPAAPAAAPAPTAVAQPPAAPAPAEKPPAPAPAARVAASPATPHGSLPDRYRNGLRVMEAGDFDGAAAIWESLLAEEHGGAFTLLVETACERDTVRAAFRGLAAAGPVFIVGKQVRGRNCFRVCVGTYASREAAGGALAALPAEFRSVGASVAPVAAVLKR